MQTWVEGVPVNCSYWWHFLLDFYLVSAAFVVAWIIDLLLAIYDGEAKKVKTVPARTRNGWQLRDYLEINYGGLDVLVNNARIALFSRFTSGFPRKSSPNSSNKHTKRECAIFSSPFWSLAPEWPTYRAVAVIWWESPTRNWDQSSLLLINWLTKNWINWWKTI